MKRPNKPSVIFCVRYLPMNRLAQALYDHQQFNARFLIYPDIDAHSETCDTEWEAFAKQLVAATYIGSTIVFMSCPVSGQDILKDVLNREKRICHFEFDHRNLIRNDVMNNIRVSDVIAGLRLPILQTTTAFTQKLEMMPRNVWIASYPMAGKTWFVEHANIRNSVLIDGDDFGCRGIGDRLHTWLIPATIFYGLRKNHFVSDDQRIIIVGASLNVDEIFAHNKAHDFASVLLIPTKRIWIRNTEEAKKSRAAWWIKKNEDKLFKSYEEYLEHAYSFIYGATHVYLKDF